MAHKDEMILCNTIEAHGWKQGSLFLSSPSNLGIGKSKKKYLYLLVTHSCDVVHGSLEDEPYAEAILAKAISDTNGNLTHGKNSRKIHVELHKNKEAKLCEFSTSNRIFFDRRKLADFEPATTYQIDETILKNLIDWLSKKYNRAAFPNSFNDRLKEHKITEKIKDILKNNGHDVMGLYIKLDSYKELADNEPYKILFLFMVISDGAKNSDMTFDNILEKIVEKIELNPKIQVSGKYKVLTLDEMTAKDMNIMDHWDYEYLSYRDKPGGDIIKKR